MNRAEQMSYKGQRILYFDYRGLRGEELLAQLKANTKTVLETPGNEILTLSDFTGTYATDEFMAYAQSDESKAAAKKTKRKAFLGVTGVKKIFLNVYNTVTGVKARAVDDIEAAKDYLVS